MLSYLHSIREELGLQKTFVKNGHAGAYLLRARFNAGQEKALWMSMAVAEGTEDAKPNKMKLVASDELRKIFESEYRTAGKNFDENKFRKGWDSFHAAKFGY